MSGLLVLTAVELEARGLARELGLARVVSSPWPRFSGRGIDVVPVGLHASLIDSRGLDHAARPALLISAGTCGALSAALTRAALVVPRVVLDASGGRFTVDPDAHDRALAAAATGGHPTVTEPIVTSGEIIDSPEAKAALRRRTGACAVDMESATLVAFARERGLRALVVRAVCDTAEQALPPELARLVDEGGRTRAGRAAVLALRRPGLIVSGIALQRGTARALKVVAAVLARLAEADDLARA